MHPLDWPRAALVDPRTFLSHPPDALQLTAVVPMGGLKKSSAMGKSGPGPVERVCWATGTRLYGSPKAHYGVKLAEKRLSAPFGRLWREV